MSTEKVLFYARMEHPKIVMETKKRFKDDGEATGGKVIQFDKHHYQTSDPEVIEFIRNHPLFGSEYVEVQERKPEPAPVGKPTVGKSAENEQFVEMENRILSQVEAKMNAVVEQIAALVQAPKTAPESDEDEEEDTDTKKDKKSAKKGK